MFGSRYSFTTWMTGALVLFAIAFTFHEPTRKKVLTKLPDKLTSVFDDDPSDTLPKDLVLGLTDTYDLGFALKNVNGDGQITGPEELRGKIAVVLVWNTDCGGQCLATMRHMQKLARKYAAKDVVAITINNDSLTKGMSDNEVKKYVEDNGVQLPVLMMDLSTGQAFWPNDCKYGMSKQPFHELLVYDRNGAVRFRANQDYLRPVVQELIYGGYENYKEEKVREGTNPPLVIAD